MVEVADAFLASRDFMSRPSEQWPEMAALAAALDAMDEPTAQDMSLAVEEAFGRSAQDVAAEDEFGELARRARVKLRSDDTVPTTKAELLSDEPGEE